MAATDLIIVLVKPKTAGNIGAIARVMKNFGVERLWLVSPQCDHLSKETMDRASKANQLLLRARIVSWREVESVDIVVGTTSQFGSDYNLVRTPHTPNDLAPKIRAIKNRSIALVFGPEDAGLSNAQIESCDMVVTIPTDPDFSVMNLSHAVAIVLYEFAHTSKATERFIPITAAEKLQLLKLSDQAISALSFLPANKAQTQKRLWRRLVGKSLLTKREAYALMGFLSQIIKQLHRK